MGLVGASYFGNARRGQAEELARIPIFLKPSRRWQHYSSFDNDTPLQARVHGHIC